MSLMKGFCCFKELSYVLLMKSIKYQIYLKQSDHKFPEFDIIFSGLWSLVHRKDSMIYKLIEDPFPEILNVRISGDTGGVNPAFLHLTSLHYKMTIIWPSHFHA